MSSASAGDVEYINYNLSMDSAVWVQHTVVTTDSAVSINDLYISDGIVVENNGSLTANFHVADNAELWLRNSGVLNATYDIGVGGRVVQLVHSADDFTDAGGAFDIRVNSADGLVLDKLIEFADGRTITLHDSVLILGKRGNYPIRLSGENVIYVQDLSLLGDVPIIDGLFGDGDVRIENAHSSDMFMVVSYVEDGKLYGRLRRETDYVKVLGAGDGRGVFLNMLRRWDSDDRLLRHMDSAQTPGELEAIMRGSVRMRPINMMRPVRALNLLDMYGVSAVEFNSVGVRVVGLRDADVYGTTVRLAGNVTDSVIVGATLFAGAMDYVSDTDELSAYLVSGAIDAQYLGRRFMMRGRAGVTAASFESGAVWNDGVIEENPTGVSRYIGLDAGLRYNAWNGVVFIPFVGAMYDDIEILGNTQTNFAFNAGADLGFRTSGYDVNYEYFGRVRVTTNGDAAATLRIGAMSDFDAAGGAVEFTKIFSDDMPSYEIKVNVNFTF